MLQQRVILLCAFVLSGEAVLGFLSLRDIYADL